MLKEILTKTALETGAAKAVVIPQDKIVLSSSFRDICATNQCGSYGHCWMCPPDIGEIEPLMEQVRSFPSGLLYQSIFALEDSYDFEGMFEAAAKHAQLSQQVQQAVKPLLQEKFLHLSCGGCRLCETCAKRQGDPCRRPEDALASMEGYGIDVYNTCKDTPLQYINGQDTVTYFGIVLFRS